ncbi:MAG: PilN domain-containing protein [Gammaproteobacteria bacterium]
MARINLLPWREERRKERKQKFMVTLGAAAGGSALLIFLVHMVFQDLIDYQNERNSYLDGEIQKLAVKVKAVQDLEKQRQKLIDRMHAIEQLQTSRPIVVRLFDEIVNSLPEGISLTEIQQTSTQVTIKGIAESNARVSNFMRNIDGSPWLKDPKLNIIETKDDEGRRINNFTLIFQQLMEPEPDVTPGHMQEGGGGAGATGGVKS